MRKPNRPSPEVIREFNDRGTLWLLEDPANLRDLLMLIEPEVAEQLDFTRAQRVNRSFVPADLQKQESDLIVLVPWRGGSARSRRRVWVYILLEHQSRPDPLMPLRLLLYMTQLWDSQRRDWEARRTPAHRRRLRPVIPLVFYTGERRWETPLRLASLMDVPPELERFVPSWETLVLNLHRTPPEALTRFSTAVGHALRVLKAERASKEQMERALEQALAGLEVLPEEAVAEWFRAAWYIYLLVFHRRAEPEYTELSGLIEERARRSKFWVKEELELMAKTMAQLVEERGVAKGRAEGEALGRAEGEAQGLRRALLGLLENRFGALHPDVRAALAEADVETLDAWFRAALTARSLSEVGIPRNGHGS